MKKFLTVLLALSVVFTYTVGSAFAATLTGDAKSSAETFIDAQAQSYLTGDTNKFVQAETTYMNTLTFDKDGRLSKAGTDIAAGYTGLVSKDVVKKAADTATEDAKTAFLEYVAKFKANLDDSTYTENYAITQVKAIFDAVTGTTATFAANILGTSTVTITANLTDANILGVDATPEVDCSKLLATQLKADKTAALAELAKYQDTLANYSNDVAEWSFTLTASGATDFDDAIATGASITYGNLLGILSAPAADKVYTAKQFVEAVVIAQSNSVNGAASTDVATQKTSIGTVQTALEYAKVGILGHKTTTDENWYFAAVPTIEELKNDTSLATAKSNAITQMKAALASKKIEVANDIQSQINAFNQKATLSTADKDNLAKLNAAKSALETQTAAAEEVFTAQINYCETTTAVKNALYGVSATVASPAANTILKKIADYAVASYTLDNSTLKDYAAITSDVAKIKAEAALRSEQKDVNGKPYYDANVLAANLAKAVKYLYTDANPLYSTALTYLSAGFESALINSKVDYIDFITGTKAASFTPVDSKGKDVTSAWNESTATAGKANGNITAMANGSANPYVVVGVTALYDKAQKAELKTLVSETEKAIEAATTIAQIEKIFAEANDKYEAIATTEDHFAAWTGSLGSSYALADYDKELLAYATYFVNKVTTTDYPADVDTAAEVMTNVVYPIMYTVYTKDELAAKVTEAKAAIDNIKSTISVKEQKKAVETLIANLPSTSAIALTNKDAIVAAADALDAYKEIPGSTSNPVTNETVLANAIKAYESLAAKEIADAFKDLDAKTITIADADAVKTLRDKYDAYTGFTADYYTGGKTLTSVNDNDASDVASVKKLEKELLDAQIANVKTLMIKLPANPTSKDLAQVEAARAAYEALSLAGKKEVVGSLQYQNLIDAEEALTVYAKYAVTSLKITASSKAYKGKIVVKWTVKGDATGVKYQVYKSTKKYSGYKKAFTTSKKTYTNTKNVKKGVRYYYKVRAYKVIDGKTYYSDWSTKAQRVAK